MDIHRIATRNTGLGRYMDPLFHTVFQLQKMCGRRSLEKGTWEVDADRTRYFRSSAKDGSGVALFGIRSPDVALAQRLIGIFRNCRV